MAKDAATVKKLLKEGVDVNAAQGDGMTALHWAALNGDAELASMLLYAGANLGAKTRIGGYTPLHLAAQVGNAAVIAPMIAAGAPVAAATTTGATALMQASHAGSADAVRMLLENSLLIYGSPMGNSNVHNHKRCPLFIAGHAGGALKGNLHIKAADGTPMANAMLSALRSVGVPLDAFGDSTAAMDLNSAPAPTVA